jgi:hypothetical protein
MTHVKQKDLSANGSEKPCADCGKSMHLNIYLGFEPKVFCYQLSSLVSKTIKTKSLLPIACGDFIGNEYSRKIFDGETSEAWTMFCCF